MGAARNRTHTTEARGPTNTAGTRFACDEAGQMDQPRATAKQDRPIGRRVASFEATDAEKLRLQ